MMGKKIKKILKKNTLLYAANAYIKARQTSRGLARLTSYYTQLAQKNHVTYSEAWALQEVRLRMARRGLVPTKRPRGQLRIFWVGTNWNQDNSGFLQALETFGEVITFKDVNGRYGLLEPFKVGADSFQNVQACIESNGTCLREQLQTALQDGKIDLLMGQMWATRISADVLKEIQEMGIITANISMDDKLPQHWGYDSDIRCGSVGLCPGLDLVLTSTPDSCLWYAVEGYPALFWPMASDPNRFKPYSEAKKEYDVSFIGNKYGMRGKIIEGLRQAGIKVEAFGSGWPNGRANADQSAEIFGKSRIILGVGNIAYNEDIFTIKLRDFDATMAGALYITHRNPDLLTLFEEGKEIECYLSIDECVNKIRYYLDHPAERIAIANAAATRARRDHTWEQRLSTAFGVLRLLPKQAKLVVKGG